MISLVPVVGPDGEGCPAPHQGRMTRVGSGSLEERPDEDALRSKMRRLGRDFENPRLCLVGDGGPW